MEKRIIGLDYGEARTGVAVSDLLGITAQGVTSINHSSDKELIEKLKPIFLEYSPSKVVVGLPLNMNATSGERVKKTKRFICKIKKEFNVEVETIDERLTTVVSHKAMTELGVKKDRKKQIVDMMSAILILQTYLEQNK